jgi:hypothetical protein
LELFSLEEKAAHVAGWPFCLRVDRAGFAFAVEPQKDRRGELSMAKHSAMVFATWLSLVLPAWCGHTLTRQEQKIMDVWLSQHPKYRLATDADCECSDDIQQMKTGYGGKWKPYPDYHPYVVTGDFNSDGVGDFAAVVIDRSKTAKNFTLLIFNGPFGSKPPVPAYFESGLDLRGQGMSFGPPRPKPYRIVVGPFESDNTWILVPKGRTYKVQVNDNE